MLHDGRKNFDIEYNLLNLPYTVKQNNELKATYAYLADGTKAKVSAPPASGGSNMSKACPDGFDYLGSLVFKCENNARTLESTSFGGGRINKTTNGYDINYFITDHLGSTRAIVDNTGSIKEQKDYYAFGMEHENPNLMTSTNRWGFSGKEKQTTANINYLDFGARMYDEFLGRWFVQDPLAEKYYSWSSYNYCMNSPLKYVDPDGKEIKLTSEVVDGKTIITVTITGKLINESSTAYTTEQMQSYADRMVASIASTYTGSDGNVSWNGVANITVASDDNPLSITDHAFRIVDKGKIPDGNGEYAAETTLGIAAHGENVAYLSTHMLDRTPSTEGTYAGTLKKLHYEKKFI
jgi:RHS repeat-associated protein